MADKYIPKKAVSGKVLLRNWWNSVVESNFSAIFKAFSEHVAGTADKHSAEHIDYDENTDLKTKIDRKADKTSVDAALEQKADKTYVDEFLERIKYYGSADIMPSDRSCFTLGLWGDRITGITSVGKTQAEIVIPYELHGEKIIYIEDGAFGYCSTLTRVTIPGSVMYVGCRAFENCSMLTSVSFSDGLRGLGSYAFYGCSNLVSITFPKNFKTIENCAFGMCNNLTEVIIPKSVTKIADDAFDSCSNLTIHCEQGSYADTYAQNNGIPVKYTDISMGEEVVSLSKTSRAVNFRTLAGSKSFTIVDVNKETNTYTLDDVTGLEVGDVYSVHVLYTTGSSSQAENYGAITNINSDINEITVDKLFCDGDFQYIADEQEFLSDGYDNEKNTFRIINKPMVGTRVIGDGAHSEGIDNKALSKGSHSEGRGSIAQGSWSHAEGNKTQAGYSAHSEGNGTKALGFESHAEGGSTNANGGNSHAEGRMTTANGENSHAEGYLAIANGSVSHAEGQTTTANGEFSHSEGWHTNAEGNQSHAEGGSTIANGDLSHAEGAGTKADNYASHSEGDTTTAKGYASHSEGYYTTAKGYASHSEGYTTTAGGDRSHSEGNSTNANGYASHAEGGNTTANGSVSHAEGSCTVAEKAGAHAEGDHTNANGGVSHAEGGYTNANGYGSHAEGDHTIASANFSHVQGKYNIEDTNNKYAHIVGNGTSDTARSNAHTVDWNGNAWFAGDIKVGGTSYDNGKNVALESSISQVLPTMVEVNTIYDLGKQSNLTINMPLGEIGDFVLIDFISSDTETTLTVSSASGLIGFDLIPATSTIYTLYFDWGAIGYDGENVTYGWRCNYSEYAMEVA